MIKDFSLNNNSIGNVLYNNPNSKSILQNHLCLNSPNQVNERVKPIFHQKLRSHCVPTWGGEGGGGVDKQHA